MKKYGEFETVCVLQPNESSTSLLNRPTVPRNHKNMSFSTVSENRIEESRIPISTQ